MILTVEVRVDIGEDYDKVKPILAALKDIKDYDIGIGTVALV